MSRRTVFSSWGTTSLHRRIFNAIVVNFEKGGRDRADVLMDMQDVLEVAERAEYFQGRAHVEIKHIFSFGTGITRVRVRKVSIRSTIISAFIG